MASDRENFVAAQRVIADREASDLAAVKAREAAAREAIARGDYQVEIGPFVARQLGLFPIYGDRQGCLWRQEGGTLILVGPKPLMVPANSAFFDASREPGAVTWLPDTLWSHPGDKPE